MRVFDTTPSARHLIAMSNQKWNAAGATGELVDNAFGDKRGDASEVVIIYDKRERKLTVRDNGRGMDYIGRLFKLGDTIGWSPTDIGQFGSGGTMALLWLADKVRIYTMRDGKVMWDHVVWKECIEDNQYPQVKNEWEDPNGNTPTWLKELGHGTHIDLWLKPTRVIKEDQIQRELARIYAPGLRHGKKIEWITISGKRHYGQTLKPDLFPMPKDKDRVVKLDLNIPLDGVRLRATGVVALVDDWPYKDSLVSLGFSHRIVMNTRACYSNPDGGESYAGSGVVGYIDLLGEQWRQRLATTKDDIDDARAFAELMQAIFVKIKPLLEMTEKDRLALVLSALSLELTAAFNGINRPDFNLGGENGGEHGAASAGYFHQDGMGPVDDNVLPFPAIRPRVVDPSRRGPYPGGQQKPPAARIDLLPQTDTAIDGALCRLTIPSDRDISLQVEINKDHDLVEELLKPRMVNRMALGVMITRELASALVRHETVMKRTLAKRVIERLDALTDDLARERLLARLLMDSVRLPRADTDEAVA